MRVRSFYCTFVALLLLTAQSAGAELNKTSEYLQLIVLETHSFLLSELSGQSPADELLITINEPDARLQLVPCDNDLTYQLHGKSTNASNVTVKVSCNSKHNWGFYITARIERLRSIALAKHNLDRGTVISREDIRVDKRRTSQAASSRYSTPETIPGMVVKRPIGEGEIIRSSSLTEPLAVQKGDQVKIRAQTGSVSIITSGTAMAKGKIGEQIRVKNSSSEQIIKARISDTGQVDVLL